jgi:hypothetical protein
MWQQGQALKLKAKSSDGQPLWAIPLPHGSVSRFMRSSIAMIDYHYGHLTRDSREHAVSLLDALAIERAVDAGWTPAVRPRSLSPTGFRSHAERDPARRWTSGEAL